MKVKLLAHFVNDKDREGNAILNRNGEPQRKVQIKIPGNDSYISTFCDPHDPVTYWKKGDEVNIIVEQNRMGYWNFKRETTFPLAESQYVAPSINASPMPQQPVGDTQRLVQRIEILEAQVKTLQGFIKGLMGHSEQLKEEQDADEMLRSIPF